MITHFSPEEEHDLLQRITQDPEAFRVLYQHYFPRVYRYVAYRVGREQDTEDIVADIFTKIVEAITRFEYRGTGSFAAWLFRIAHNEVAQFYRQSYEGEKIIPFEDLPNLASDGVSPDEALQQKEQFIRLKQMVDSLPERRREVVSLRYFAGLRNQDIAEILNLDERTIASHLSRGLTDLQRRYHTQEVDA